MSFVAAAVVGGIGAAGSIVTGAMGAGASRDAANAQANAANNAAQLQYQSGQNALSVQEQMWADQQRTQAPWLGAGSQALAQLQYLSGIYNPNATTFTPGTLPDSGGSPSGAAPVYGTSPGGRWIQGGPSESGAPVAFQPAATGTAAPNSAGTLSTLSMNPTVNTSLGAPGSLMTPWSKQFQAPTNVTEQNDPGYQFRLQQGQQALERSAAAKGTLFSGGTGKAEQRYGQDFASNEYGNVYNRALGQYQQDYNIYNNNQTNAFNRLATIAGIGQTSANQLTSAGGSTANNIGNTMLTTGAQVGQQMNNAGAARGSGYVGAANAWGGSINGATNNLSQLSMLNAMIKGGGRTAPGSGSGGMYSFTPTSGAPYPGYDPFAEE